jgi:Protein of unknown function (DUF2934)
MDPNLTDRIRERAYQIWFANGCRDGEAEQNWLAAECEILHPAEREIKQPAKAATPAKRSAANKPNRAIGRSNAKPVAPLTH